MSLTQNKQERTLVIILLVGAFVCTLNQMMLTPAFATLMVEFDKTATQVQWLTSGYSMVEAIIIPLNAFLLGRFSTKRLYVFGFCLFLAGCVLCAWSPTFWVLMLGRLLQATCTGIITPLMFTLVLLIFPIERRGMAMGLVTLVMGVAPVMGPTFAGAIIDYVGWHFMYVIMSALALGMLIFASIGMTSYGKFDRITFDKVSVLFSTLGLFGVLYGLSTFTSANNYVLVVAMMLIGIVFMVLFVRRQLKLNPPMLSFKICKSKDYLHSQIINFICNAAICAFGVVVPLYLQIVRGYPATISAAAMAPGALLGAIMAPIAGTLYDKRGARKIALLGISLLVFSFLGLSFCWIEGPSLWFIVPIMAIGGLGNQCIINPVCTWGINTLDNSLIQHANSFSTTLMQVCCSFMTALVISLSALAPTVAPNASVAYQNALGYHFSFIVLLLSFVAMLILAMIWVKDRENQTETLLK